MTEAMDRLKTALADRYRIDRHGDRLPRRRPQAPPQGGGESSAALEYRVRNCSVRRPGPLHRTVAAELAIALLFLFTAACRPQGDSSPEANGSADAENLVRAASAAWDEAHNSSDLAALMQLYSETAVSMPYSRPAIEGRAAIEADFQEFFASFQAQHKTTIVSVEVVGDWAIEYGRYQLSLTPKDGSAPLTESGKHIVIRTSVDGAWKVQWEIWNTDTPP